MRAVLLIAWLMVLPHYAGAMDTVALKEVLQKIDAWFYGPDRMVCEITFVYHKHCDNRNSDRAETGLFVRDGGSYYIRQADDEVVFNDKTTLAVYHDLKAIQVSESSEPMKLPHLAYTGTIERLTKVISSYRTTALDNSREKLTISFGQGDLQYIELVYEVETYALATVLLRFADDNYYGFKEKECVEIRYELKGQADMDRYAKYLDFTHFLQRTPNKQWKVNEAYREYELITD